MQVTLTDKFIWKKDLRIVNGVESDNDSHSPILGYAYDGNPIYASFGFVNKTGGNVCSIRIRVRRGC